MTAGDEDRGGTGDRRLETHRRNAELRDDLTPILAAWEAVSADEPWHVHPERYGLDSLHETVRAVLDVVITVATTAALRGYHRSDTGPTPEWASDCSAPLRPEREICRPRSDAPGAWTRDGGSPPKKSHDI